MVEIFLFRGIMTIKHKLATFSKVSNAFDFYDGKVKATAVYSNDLQGETTRDLLVSSTGFFGYDSSTRKKKTNIEDINDTSWILKVKPVNYSYIKSPEKHEEGLIAEDVVEGNKYYAYLGEEGEVEGVNYRMLVVPVINELQKLSAKLDGALKEIESLKTKASPVSKNKIVKAKE